MTQPLITIGITVFNAEETILRGIFSALSQSWRNFEIVVVDDCSNDESYVRVDQIRQQYGQIRLYRNSKNCGVAVSRNLILDKAKGEFVIFFDDDDESLPDRVEKQYLRIVNYEKQFADGALVICHTARRIIYPNKKERIESTKGVNKNRRAPFGLAVAKRILLGTPLKDAYGSCPTCCQMARLSTYRKLGGFDPLFRRGEDTDFNIRLAIAGGHFVGVGEPLVVQIMTKTSEKSLQDEYKYWRLIIEKHKTIMDSEAQLNFCISWLDMKQTWLERKPFIFILKLSRLFLKNPVVTLQRLYLAIRNIGSSSQFSRFHMSKPD